MKAYGYEKGSDREESTELYEVSLLLSIKEIDSLVNFLKYVKERHSSVSSVPGLYHTHFKDWIKDSRVETDFVVVTKFDNT